MYNKNADGKPAHGHARLLTDSARKRNRKVLANYNETRINIGHLHGWNWRKRWEFKHMLKCKHQCHCACSLEIGTCIINDDGRQAAYKNDENTRYTPFEGKY